MKTQYYIVCLVAFFLSACEDSDTGASGDYSNEGESVSLYGTWDYSWWFANWSECTERAEGTMVVNLSDSYDLDTIVRTGKVFFQPENEQQWIKTEQTGPCVLIDIGEQVDTGWKGLPETQVATQYIQYVGDRTAANTNFQLDGFRSGSILEVRQFPNGLILYSWYRKRYTSY